MNIGVLGAGSWGTALATVLANRFAPMPVYIWTRDSQQLRDIQKHRENKRYLQGVDLPNSIHSVEGLQEFVYGVRDILIALPSYAVVGMLKQMKPFLTKSHRLVCATKGLEPQSGRFFHEVVNKMLGFYCPYAVLSGPSFAKEVAQKLPTAVTIATDSAMFAKDLIKYFHSDVFRVYLNKDMVGVQLGGVVKNILAVAVGISDGLNYGANAGAALITRGLVEMYRLGIALGANSETLMGLSCVGDVILTCKDNKSRNRRFGLALAAGQTLESAKSSIGQVVEATHNAAAICRLAAKVGVKMPILMQVNLILSNKTTPFYAAKSLVARSPTREDVCTI